MAKDGTALDELIHGELVPEGNEDTHYAFSRWSLSFTEPRVEAAYVKYRNASILKYLRWLLGLGSVMVFGGSIIDFTRPNTDATLALTVLRSVVSVGMLFGIALTYTAAIRRNLQLFIGVGTVGIHVVWLITVPIVGPGIADYVEVLPINIMLTFLVSGLMFRWARWVALAATVAYTGALLWQHATPLAPLFYMVVSGFYAGFAAYVAERARREAWADTDALAAAKAETERAMARTEEERERSERLLLNVLPREIAERKKMGEDLIADRYDDACVLFADIVGFTQMSARMEPEVLVDILDEIFSRFDRIAEGLDLEKIKTIGDCYMMAAGVPRARASKTKCMAEAALRMQDALAEVSADTGIDLKLRIGIHCGPVVAGVIGHSKFIYDLWGDTVNVASRMESTAEVGCIQVSEQMHARLGGVFAMQPLGLKRMKGKDELPVYQLTGRL